MIFVQLSLAHSHVGMHVQAEEERRYAKMRALQAAFPALAIGAGAVGALVGGNKQFIS